MANQEILEFQQKYGKGWLQKYNSHKNNTTYTKHGVKRRAHWDDFDEYRNEVKLLTEQNANDIPGIHKRGFNLYHIDHKASIRWGYDNGIMPEQIAHPSNCEMVWWKDNIRKSDQCKFDSDNEWLMRI